MTWAQAGTSWPGRLRTGRTTSCGWKSQWRGCSSSSPCACYAFSLRGSSASMKFHRSSNLRRCLTATAAQCAKEDPQALNACWRANRRMPQLVASLGPSTFRRRRRRALGPCSSKARRSGRSAQHKERRFAHRLDDLFCERDAAIGTASTRSRRHGYGRRRRRRYARAAAHAPA